MFKGCPEVSLPGSTECQALYREWLVDIECISKICIDNVFNLFPTRISNLAILKLHLLVVTTALLNICVVIYRCIWHLVRVRERSRSVLIQKKSAVT